LAVIVALMVVAGCLLVTAGVGLILGTGAALVAAGVSLLAGAWLAEQALEGE
jgi:hypothetical protein